MHELQNVVDAYRQACERGERAALATVVNVIGSAYRRPGARMLITESGQTAGSISGGCLERDVAERAAQVMATGTARIVEYDTRGEDDIVWGLGLGCNGVVQVFVESLHCGSHGAHALQFIAECLDQRKRGLIATVINAPAGEAHNQHEAGERLLLDEELNICDQALNDFQIMAQIREDAKEASDSERAMLRAYETSAGQTTVFFDTILPPRPLVIFGAEQDAIPLVRLARMLGWHVTVVDTRARQATRNRFSEADKVVLCRASDVAAQIALMPHTAAVVMTHNYLDDVALLGMLLPSPVNYLGLLGPHKRALKLLDELRVTGSVPTRAQIARLHSPIGMDIGAETAEEIALAIIAEIKADCAARRGGFLRDRTAPIHDENTHTAAMMGFSGNPSAAESAILTVCHSS